jgi:hypothetical protein
MIKASYDGCYQTLSKGEERGQPEIVFKKLAVKRFTNIRKNCPGVLGLYIETQISALVAFNICYVCIRGGPQKSALAQRHLKIYCV